MTASAAPAIAGPAPRGLTTRGSPRFCRLNDSFCSALPVSVRTNCGFLHVCCLSDGCAVLPLWALTNCCSLQLCRLSDSFCSAQAPGLKRATTPGVLLQPAPAHSFDGCFSDSGPRLLKVLSQPAPAHAFDGCLSVRTFGVLDQTGDGLRVCCCG